MRSSKMGSEVVMRTGLLLCGVLVFLLVCPAEAARTPKAASQGIQEVTALMNGLKGKGFSKVLDLFDKGALPFTQYLQSILAIPDDITLILPRNGNSWTKLPASVKKRLNDANGNDVRRFLQFHVLKARYTPAQFQQFNPGTYFYTPEGWTLIKQSKKGAIPAVISPSGTSSFAQLGSSSPYSSDLISVLASDSFLIPPDW